MYSLAFFLEIIMDVMLSDAGLTMSSREIADLVESRHSDVVRSIERLMQSETIWNGYAPTAYTNPQNRQIRHDLSGFESAPHQGEIT